MWIALKDGESIDFEDEGDSIPLTLTVTDSGGLSDSIDVTITVNDVNENPSVSVGQGVTPGGVIAAPTVDENNAGAPLGEISVSDPDAGDTYELSVSDARFEAKQDDIGGWWVKLRDDQSFDFETEESLTITVTVTDAGGLTGTADVPLTVRNVDEAPSAPVVRDGVLSVNENDDGASVTSLADSMDPEGDAITYSVDDARFEVTSGLVLKLKDGMMLDHETDESVTLMLTASDPAGNTSAATMVTVAVNDMNEDPTITAADGSVAENAAGAMVGAVSATDPDAGDSQTYSTDNADFEVADGMLKLVDGASLNYEDGDSVTVNVTVTDSDGLTDSAEVTVTVTDVNEDPSVEITSPAEVPMKDGLMSNLTVPENMTGPPPLALITVTDPDAADAGALTGRDGMAATTVDDERFEVILDPIGGLWLALKADVMLDHEAEADGMIDVTVTYTDSAMNTNSATATVIISDLNEAPTSVTVQDGATPGGHPASSTVEENVEGAILGEILVEDQDDGDDWTPSVTDTRFAVLEDDIGGWWLKLADGMSLDYETDPTVDVTVTVTDTDGLTAETVATITVSDVGESPTAPTARATTLAVYENAAGTDVSVLDTS